MKILTKTLLCALGVIQMSVSALSAEVTPEYLKAQKNGAVTNVRIKIVDDEDSPIADATVNVLMGMLNNAQSHWIRGVTDTNGVFGLEGKTCGNEIIITISKKWVLRLEPYAVLCRYAGEAFCEGRQVAAVGEGRADRAAEDQESDQDGSFI